MLFARTARFSFRTIGSTLLLGSGFAFAADPVPASPSPAPAPSTTAPAAAASGTPDSKPAAPAAPVTPAAGTTPAPAAKPAAAPVVVRQENLLTQEEQSIVDLTNNERARYGLPAFTPTPALMRIAREQSQLMATYRVMSHAVGGRHLTHRLQQAGYPTYTVAENCAQGQGSPQAAVQTWMASAGHRNNLLNRGYSEIGVAMVWGSDGRPYYTQVFSVPVGIPVVVTRTVTSTPVGTQTVNPAPAPVAPAPAVVPASGTSPAQSGSGVVPASGTTPAK